MTLLMGRSLAGHDKGQVYVVIREDDGFCYLANGTTKTIDSPKKKKYRHLQLIKKMPAEVQQISDEENDLTDLLIKRVIKIYTGLHEEKKAKE
ncbi:MAG: KOW domain-containing RNA-binding protein [Lachnospiraceae bacterium]|nr:KOW domain-containing RNA-binding protein [Lachnospiraceae bacterium]